MSLRGWHSLVLAFLAGVGEAAALAQAAVAKGDRIADLRQQRATAARDAAEAAERVAKTGSNDPLFLRERIATRRRLVVAQRGLLGREQMTELLKGELRQLRDLEQEHEKRGGKGGGAAHLDLLEIRYSRLALEQELAGLTGEKDETQAARLAGERLQVARQAYSSLQKATGGRFDVASFHNLLLWSRRWMEAQLAVAGEDRQRLQALTAYLDRSKALEAVFQKRKDTDAYARNLAAAEAQRLEAESLIAKAQGQTARAWERLAKRAQDLHLVHKALALSGQVPDYGRFVEARAECFAAEAAVLQGTGKTDLLARCQFDYVRDMRDWEEQARSQTQKQRDPKLELDLATARYARLTAELALEK